MTNYSTLSELDLWEMQDLMNYILENITIFVMKLHLKMRKCNGCNF